MLFVARGNVLNGEFSWPFKSLQSTGLKMSVVFIFHSGFSYFCIII